MSSQLGSLSSSTTQLPFISRFITTDDPFSGKSVFLERFAEEPSRTSTPEGIVMSLCYATAPKPADYRQDFDLASYADIITNPPDLVIPGGFSARVVNFPPGFTSAMHRTLTPSVNFVIEGKVDLILDSGEVKTLKRGDSAVQRTVDHAWRNASVTKWARITAVALPAVTI